MTNFIALALLLAISHIRGMAAFVALSLGIQYAVFVLHGLPWRSEKLYDLSGSATHFGLVAFALHESRPRSLRQILIALFSVVWMTRLGTFLFLRISRDGKDERFDNLKLAWISFLGAWSVQALWVVLVQLPVILINGTADVVPLGYVDALAFVCWLTGFMIEFVADVQKFTFRQDPKNRNRFIYTGLWRRSRHPNYFGEIVMWLAVATSTSAAGMASSDPTLHFAWLSPLFTAFLLLKVFSSSPLIPAPTLTHTHAHRVTAPCWP